VAGDLPETVTMIEQQRAAGDPNPEQAGRQAGRQAGSGSGGRCRTEQSSVNRQAVRWSSQAGHGTFHGVQCSRGPRNLAGGAGRTRQVVPASGRDSR